MPRSKLWHTSAFQLNGLPAVRGATDLDIRVATSLDWCHVALQTDRSGFWLEGTHSFGSASTSTHVRAGPGPSPRTGHPQAAPLRDRAHGCPRPSGDIQSAGPPHALVQILTSALRRPGQPVCPALRTLAVSTNVGGNGPRLYSGNGLRLYGESDDGGDSDDSDDGNDSDYSDAEEKGTASAIKLAVAEFGAALAELLIARRDMGVPLERLVVQPRCLKRRSKRRMQPPQWETEVPKERAQLECLLRPLVSQYEWMSCTEDMFGAFDVRGFWHVEEEEKYWEFSAGFVHVATFRKVSPFCLYPFLAELGLPARKSSSPHVNIFPFLVALRRTKNDRSLAGEEADGWGSRSHMTSTSVAVRVIHPLRTSTVSHVIQLRRVNQQRHAGNPKPGFRAPPGRWLHRHLCARQRTSPAQSRVAAPTRHSRGVRSPQKNGSLPLASASQAR
ncbi:uncharacterized protein BXZ73DRAFT_82669 [Epithele typhae]|uniref:uncharacterized protein n=1 Tax=Epithele typhae TaxID=378194 RepID=UPI0020083238|nr:uncharacterized protein BXZ73DRAFT_82669 [Epithele typhae]KAH9911677.1 hypothetical protein BXZ73DRAFT_82669 [Epithele typhae]